MAAARGAGLASGLPRAAHSWVRSGHYHGDRHWRPL